MLSSTEPKHGILHAHKYKKKNRKFRGGGGVQAQVSLECFFACLWMFKCQQLWAFKIFERKSSRSAKMSRKYFDNLGAKCASVLYVCWVVP